MEPLTQPTEAILLTNRQLAKEFGKRIINITRHLRHFKNTTPLTESQSMVLTLLLDKRSWRISDLATIEGVRVPSMTELISRMEKQGLVTKNTSTHDLRGVEVSITEKGKSMIQTRLRYDVDLMAQRLSILSEEEKTLILRVLPVMDRLFSGRVEDLPQAE